MRYLRWVITMIALGFVAPTLMGCGGSGGVSADPNPPDPGDAQPMPDLLDKQEAEQRSVPPVEP